MRASFSYLIIIAIFSPLMSGFRLLPSAFGSSSRLQLTNLSTSGEKKSVFEMKNVILYDGVCHFCNTWVNFLLRVDSKGKFRFAALQSSIGKSLLESIGKDKEDISSVILIKEPGVYFVKSDAVIEVVKELGPIANFSAKLLSKLPNMARDAAYDGVAINRYKLLGKRQECRCTDPSYSDRFIK